MSERNVEIIRALWEADRRRDWDAVLSAYDPDVVWDDRSGFWGDWGEARGREGIREAFRRWHQAFEEVEFDWDEVAHEGDRVVVTYRIRGRGRGSGLEIDEPLTLVWRLRDGRIVEVLAYTDRAEALAAAGLG
jgi:ketosteroid isomerase-like protein